MKEHVILVGLLILALAKVSRVRGSGAGRSVASRGMLTRARRLTANVVKARISRTSLAAFAFCFDLCMMSPMTTTISRITSSRC